jgi:hypothetical protein
MKCKKCGRNAESEYCFSHKPRKALNRTSSINKAEDIAEMQDFFMKIWKNRKHYSEVSGEYLGREALSIFFHHILPKEKYPMAQLDEENIILLTLDEHTRVENDIYHYQVINDKRNLLKTKYEI